MLGWFAALQPLFLGVVLLWAARFKLLGRDAAGTARRSALARLVGERRVVPAFRLVAAAELVVGIALLAPSTHRTESVAAVLLAAGFLGYLAYARRAAPDSSCGGLSARRAPVSWRGFARAGVLAGAGALSFWSATGWPAALAERPLAAAAVLLGEAAAIVALSAELDTAWLLPLRRLRIRLSHPLAGREFEGGGSVGLGGGNIHVPLQSTVQQLQRSAAYRQVARLLVSDVRDHWDEGEWRVLCYTARRDGRDTTAVFAVPRLRYEPDAVRVTLVDEASLMPG
jgi:hypothetical protein